MVIVTQVVVAFSINARTPRLQAAAENAAWLGLIIYLVSLLKLLWRRMEFEYGLVSGVFGLILSGSVGGNDA